MVKDDVLIIGAAIAGIYLLSNSKNILSGALQGAGAGLGSGVHDFFTNLVGYNPAHGIPKTIQPAYTGQVTILPINTAPSVGWTAQQNPLRDFEKYVSGWFG